jgi:galactonate dehydratase
VLVRSATGERLFTRWDFKTLLQEGYVDIISRTCRTPAASSSAARSPRWPKPTTSPWRRNCPLGPIAWPPACSLTLLANAVIQEQSLGIHTTSATMCSTTADHRVMFAYADGYVALPDKPGLGIEIAEKKSVSRPGRSQLEEPGMAPADGCVAEW